MEKNLKEKIRNLFGLAPISSDNQQNRDVWLKQSLEKIPKGKTILDAGAGEQKYKSYCGHLNYVAQDFGKYGGQGDQTGLQTGSWDQSRLDIVSDITSIPRPDNSFDAILCVEVFEHLPEPILAIREFKRLLKTNGLLIITAPFCSLSHFAPYHYYSGFNRYFYEKFLEENGFEIAELKANGNYFKYINQELRRLPQITEKYCRREPKLLEKIIIRLASLVIAKIEKGDCGSSELLNFGFNVIARKK